ncbi:MAG: ABC transporter permease subunit [Phycisphaerales bacterium]|nr:MAG: ABC transporter permease subunit [Phycisphaerales bacterium]
MGTIVLNWLIRIGTLSWLTGPIFDKELRVSSRRRRSYMLRFTYIAFFTLLAAFVWEEAVPHGSSSLFQASRMAQAGQIIVTFVVWFQFIASQVIAIVMLSTSISDEIYSKTLGLLMTTPVGSLQIVLGKLLSKLLQLLLLLAITLPLLAIVRVFGGVPWPFLVCGLSITVTTAIFLGALSLFLSIFTRRAHTVIIVTILVAGALFLLVPLLAILLFHERLSERVILRTVSYVNPYLMMSQVTESVLMSRGAGGTHWPMHCSVALGSSALLLLLATFFVRKVALRQATGQEIFSPNGKWFKRRRRAAAGARIRRVVGPCVFWKERRMPLWGKLNVATCVGEIIALGLLLLTYILIFVEGGLSEEGVQIGYVVVFVSMGILLTMVLPATCITSEKESRAWPILLTTPVSNWDILWGKFLGAARRCLVAWLLLGMHTVVFVLLGILHPMAIVQLGILVAWLVFFLCGTGLYFSTRCRRTTMAVIANVTLAGCLWAIIPLLLGLTLAVARADGDVLEFYLDMNPFVHAVVIAAATASRGDLGNYDWVQGGIRDLGSATFWILFTAGVYVGASLLFLWRAWARLRRHPV